MYSLKNRAFAGMLALLMLLSMTGCAGTISGEESSGSTPADNASSSAPAQTSSAAPVQQTAPAQTSTASGKGPLAKYTVNVYDSATPAVKVTGKLYNGIAAYVFTSADGTVVGTIPYSELGTIIWENGLSYAEADKQKAWFVENFNIYRGLDSGSSSGSSSSGSSSSSSSSYDEDGYREEVFRLINEERVANGVPEFTLDETAMEFAQLRAEEIADKFSHERPDGDSSGMYSHYTFGENIAKGYRTPADAVDGWMNSTGHRNTMLGNYADYGNYAGVGVYRKNGVIYWTLEIIAWDANA